MTSRFVSRTDSERLDTDIGAGGGVWFSRQLEMIEQRILRAKRPPQNGLAYFAVKGDVPEGAETFTRRMYEHTGQAKMVGSYSDDLPSAHVSAMPEESVKLKRVGASFSYNIDELAAVDMAQRNGQTIDLPTERGIAARTMIEEKLNDVVWNGSAEAGLYGVLNHPGVPRLNLLVASTAAHDTVFAAVAGAFQQIKSNTRGVEKPNRIILSEKVYNLLQVKLRTNTDTTLLDILAKSVNIPRTNILDAWELDAAGDGGFDAMICDRKDELVMAHVISVLFRQEPVERQNLSYKINCTAKSGGMMASYPHGMLVASFSNAL
uniref:Putative major capsid protein n=1 Tax=viral metagenome TaxID=1070528 RepID=A0A6H1ZNG1_9ZZZZ